MRRIINSWLAAGLVVVITACTGGDSVSPAETPDSRATERARAIDSVAALIADGWQGQGRRSVAFNHSNSANGNNKGWKGSSGNANSSGNGNGPWNSNGQSAQVRCENNPAAQGSAWIGPSGGYLAAGNTLLIVPPGALTQTTYITATVPAGDVSFVSYEPHGLTFRKSAALIFNTDGCDIPWWYAPDVVYIENGQIVEWIDAIWIPWLQLVGAPIDHFSGYGLAW